MHTAYQTNDTVFDALKSLVCEKLKLLPESLSYHNLAHTLDVTEQCERIARAEGVTDEIELYLLKVAALYHDTGFLRTYAHHEVVSCEIFMEDADQFGFSASQKEVITGLIMATRLPQTPTTLLQQVICDADLDYLGRDDFFEIGDSLRREFLKYGVIHSNEEWNRLQAKFLSSHQYFTHTSQQLREMPKRENIRKLPS